MKPVYLKISGAGSGLPVCSSRFWGSPDLPAGYKAPRGMRFVCQINLSEVAPYDPQGMLPHSGMLLFFAKIDHYLGDFDDMDSIGGHISGRDDVRVMYFPDCEGFAPTEDDGESPAPLKVTFSDRTERYADEHMLLAPPDHREWETWDPPYEQWIILFQVDSFETEEFFLNFMDCGVLDFLIHPDALAARDFSNVRAIVLST